MSYYRSGPGYPPHDENSHARQQSQGYLSQAGALQGYGQDDEPTYAGADTQSTAAPPAARAPTHLASLSLSEPPQFDPQPHDLNTRQPSRFQYGAPQPYQGSSNIGVGYRTPQSQYGSVSSGTYNPQDYAGFDNHGSPAQAGAPYSYNANPLPTVTHTPNSYRRYDIPVYSHSALPTTPVQNYGNTVQGTRHIAGAVVQPQGYALQNSSQPRFGANEPSQPLQYSPQVGNNHSAYHTPVSATGTGRASYTGTPTVPLHDSARSTPTTQYSQYGHSPDFRTSRTYANNEPAHSTYAENPNTFAPPAPQYHQSQNSQIAINALQRTDTTGRHPQARPLPGPPRSSVGPIDPYGYDEEHAQDMYDEQGAQEELYQQVENSLRESLGAAGRQRPDDTFAQYHRTHNGQDFGEALSIRDDYSNSNSSPVANRGGFRSGTGSMRSPGFEEHSDDSDMEAAAGLAAMRLAAEAEAAAGRPEPNGIHHRVDGVRTPASQLTSEGDDFGVVDLSSFGGGYPVGISYGGQPDELSGGTPDRFHDRRSSGWGRSVSLAADGSFVRNLSGRSGESTAPAQTDQYGTGGLTEPTLRTRRLSQNSFDEGDDVEYYDDQATPGQDMNSGIPNLPYSAGGTISRPLPPPPPHFDSQFGGLSETMMSPWATTPGSQYPVTPESYSATLAVGPPRSISLTSPSPTPQAKLPDRAKTDAEERARKTPKRLASYGAESIMSYQTPTSPHLGIDLPTLPAGRRFQPTKLSQRDFDRCREPWAMSALVDWLRMITAGESELREQPLADALLMLFTSKVPNMNIADAETLAIYVVKALVNAGILGREEEWLRFEDGHISGVLHQLTGSGCYALCLHDYDLPGRCYSTSCQRTVKRLDSQDQVQPAQDWATYYKLKKEDVEGIDKKEIEKQNIIHEILTTEQQYLDDLVLLQAIYRDKLKNANPPIIAPLRINEFIKQVFGRLDGVQKANSEFLLPQLRYRQKEQGPWISIISDIFRDWIRKAKAAYIEYAASYPQAYITMKTEEQKNSMFMVFCEQSRNNPQSRKLGWDSFLKAPITRLQRYGLLLQTVLKNMTTRPEPEYTNLQTAVEEIRNVTLDCDARVAEQSRKVDLAEIQNKLVLRAEWKNVELNITQRGRELLYRGDLQRLGSKKFDWLTTHAILLDNYMILAKVSADTSAGHRGGLRYDVSKMPIPMDLLILESSDDDPVIRSRVQGISAVAASSAPKVSSPGPGGLVHRNTDLSLSLTESSASSARTMVTSTTIDRPEGKDEKILYPFRIKHLGRESYTLYCSRSEDRRAWAERIIEAKTKHASSLFRQSAEPFSLNVLADTAFAFDVTGNAGVPKQILIKGTPLSRAIDEVEARYANAARPGPSCRARVNCATTFVQQGGKRMMAIGTDYGVYTAEVGDVRNWTRAITVQRVTQIAVLEEYNLMLLISEKSLIAYHLDVVCPASGAPPQNNSNRKAPQKLSGSKDVGFFAAGRMKDRTLVFYKKKDGLQSNFRVLEPVLQKATERKSRLLHRGTTDFFRDYDEFYIPTECTGLELFASTLAVATSKGFEVLNLDKKTPFTVPDLKQSGVATIAARLSGVDPLAMFRLSESEFICVYEECAIYINKHGDVSRSVVMEFVGRARAAAVEAGFLVLFDKDFVEVRDAQLGRLKQVIPGIEVRCLDNGRGGSNGGGGGGGGGSGVVPTMVNGAFTPAQVQNAAAATAGGGGVGGGGGGGTGQGNRTIKFAMQHPEQERSQIVMELVLNQSMGSGVGGR